MMATTVAGRTQRTGSSHARRDRAMTLRPWIDLAGCRIVDAGDDVEERRLAGTVRADEADDRLLRDREVDVVDGDEPAEALGDSAREEDIAHRPAPDASSAPVLSPRSEPAISPSLLTRRLSSSTCSSSCRRWFGKRPSGLKQHHQHECDAVQEELVFDEVDVREVHGIGPRSNAESDVSMTPLIRFSMTAWML